MPTYTFECKTCNTVEDVISSIAGLDNLKTTMYHCDELMGKVITVNSGFFARSPFPTELFEHASIEPKKFRDKYHLLDHCEEVGITSRLLEDGDVP